MVTKKRLDIRKYSNRRLYDLTRSRHVTIDDLYDLIRDGHEVSVTDATTEENITNQVLTQLILERESPKLDLFPASLLHEVVRANRQMWRSLVERWTAAQDPFRLGELVRRAFEPARLKREAEPEKPAGGDDLRETVRRLEARVERLSQAVGKKRPRSKRNRRPSLRSS
jgi:polyhydroxyalkanoate synthesis repressor PhaR